MTTSLTFNKIFFSYIKDSQQKCSLCTYRLSCVTKYLPTYLQKNKVDTVSWITSTALQICLLKNHCLFFSFKFQVQLLVRLGAIQVRHPLKEATQVRHHLKEAIQVRHHLKEATQVRHHLKEGTQDQHHLKEATQVKIGILVNFRLIITAVLCTVSAVF